MEKGKVEKLIQEFVQDQVFLLNYTKADNVISLDYDAKLTVKIGKRIAKNVKKIIANGGVDEMSKLLESDDLMVQTAAAQYLYPVKPKECLEILRKYSNSLTDDLDKLKVDDMIKGFETNNEFFVNIFEELYGKQMWKY